MQVSMKMNKKESAMLKKSSEIQLRSNMFHEVLHIMDDILKMRFIQKISRPVSQKEKQIIVEKFAGKLQNLHIKLQNIREQIFLETKIQKSPSSRKKTLSSTTDKPLDFNQTVRRIESKYSDMFYEGSFKHYHKLKTLNNFAEDLHLINIIEWSTSCIERNKRQTSCC